MKALILGCSHAAGSEMNKDLTIIIDNPESFGWLHSYPVLIAQQLGYEPLNYAIAGGSNDAMFRIFTEQLNQLTSNDIVIACWTGIDRTEIWHELDQQWLPLSIGQHSFYSIKPSTYALAGIEVGEKILLDNEYQNYRDQWSRFHINLQANKLNKLKNILALNNLAKQHAIRVININSFYPIDHCDGVMWAIDEPFDKWASRNAHHHTDWGHYFLATHQAFANLVVSKLTTNANSI
jgi:hypothetical protein